MTYRPEIDGLRGMAVWLVLLFHFEIVALARAGFIGVDVFFVISGFLISSILWGQLERGTFTLRGFYLRRFRRLAPALICVQLALLVFSYGLLLPQESKNLAAESVATQAYAINFCLWKKIDYFGLHSDSVALLHCWSLAIEEQFYFLYPLFLLVVHRYARKHFLLVLIAMAVLSFALNVGLVYAKPQAAFYLLPTRAWELVLGAMIPFAQPWFVHRRAARWAGGTLATSLLVGGLLLYRPGTPFPGFFALLPTLATATLIAASVGDGNWTTRLLSVKPLVYVGKISYSLYLVHWPIKVFATYFLPTFAVPWRWASLALAFALAALLFHTVEDPIRKGTIFATPARFVAAYAAGFAAVVMVALSALASDGWRNRFSSEVLRLADADQDQDMQARVCEYHPGKQPPRTGACRLGSDEGPLSWAVVGDSHAWALRQAFSLFLAARHEAGILAFAHRCMPIEDVGSDGCRTFASDIDAWVNDDPKLRNVVLVSIWEQPIEGLMMADGRLLTGAPAIATFERAFAHTLRSLHDAGKRIYVWEPLPTAKMSVPNALARNRAFGLHLEVAITRQEYQQRFGFMQEALAKTHELVDGTISPYASMCAAPTCAVESDGAPLFFDNNHPAWSRAPYFAHIIQEQLGVLN